MNKTSIETNLVAQIEVLTAKNAAQAARIEQLTAENAAYREAESEPVKFVLTVTHPSTNNNWVTEFDDADKAHEYKQAHEKDGLFIVRMDYLYASPVLGQTPVSAELLSALTVLVNRYRVLASSYGAVTDDLLIATNLYHEATAEARSAIAKATGESE